MLVYVGILKYFVSNNNFILNDFRSSSTVCVCLCLWLCLVVCVCLCLSLCLCAWVFFCVDKQYHSVFRGAKCMGRGNRIIVLNKDTAIVPD